MSADLGVLQPGDLAPGLTGFALPVLATPGFGHSSWRGMTLLAMLVALLDGCAASRATGDRVACHIEYGGVSHMATSTAVASAYDVEPIRIASAFLFRIVFQQQPTELAAVKLYTYADKDGVPALIHQARFPFPPPRSETSSFGFTGLQSVYDLKGRFSAVSVANNHSGDYGHEAFTQTLEHLQSAGIAAFGGGRNLREAHAPLWIERNGLRIAVLGYNEFLPRSFEAGPNWPGVAWSEDHDSPRNSNRRLRSRNAKYAGKEPPTFDQAAACGLSRRSRSKGRMRPILLKNSIAHRPRCLRRKSTSQNRAGDANDEWLRDQ